jgi:hypothetical protein
MRVHFSSIVGTKYGFPVETSNPCNLLKPSCRSDLDLLLPPANMTIIDTVLKPLQIRRYISKA